MKRFLHRYPEYKWFVKTDFKKFYQSILHELIVAALRRKFKDERFIKLIEIAVLSYDSGTELVDVLENEVEREEEVFRLEHLQANLSGILRQAG